MGQVILKYSLRYRIRFVNLYTGNEESDGGFLPLPLFKSRNVQTL